MNVFWISAAALSIIGFILLLWRVPQWQVRGAGLDAKDRIDLEIKARATLAQITAGSLFLLTAYATWNSIDVSRKALHVSQQGQITDRFAAAVELLGSPSDQAGGALPRRLGGIYALERISQESERDYWPIMEVLTGYLRERAPRDVPKERKEGADIFAGGRELFNQASDVQAVLTVLRRRARHYKHGEEFPLDLSATDLRGSYMQNAHFENVFLFAANLSNSYLTNTNLQGANLASAILDGAFLHGADLEGAQLEGSSLKGATYDASTRWPVGFDPARAGALRRAQ